MEFINKKPVREGTGWFVEVEDAVIDTIFVECGFTDAWYVGCGIIALVEIPSIREEAFKIVRRWEL